MSFPEKYHCTSSQIFRWRSVSACRVEGMRRTNVSRRITSNLFNPADPRVPHIIAFVGPPVVVEHEDAKGMMRSNTLSIGAPMIMKWGLKRTRLLGEISPSLYFGGHPLEDTGCLNTHDTVRAVLAYRHKMTWASMLPILMESRWLGHSCDVLMRDATAPIGAS